MRQKTQQGLGPGSVNPFESEDDDVPPGERITPVDSERGRMLARAAQAAILEAERELDAERRREETIVGKADRRTLPDDSVAREETKELERVSEDDARKEFDTVPGGGVNRESGGRAIARAYVSPKTPMRLKEGRLALISVDVDPEATSDSRSFPTEKALRAGSLLPPPTIPAEPRRSKTRGALPLLIAIGTAGVLTATIVVVGESESATVPVVSSSVAAKVPEPPPVAVVSGPSEPTHVSTDDKAPASPAGSSDPLSGSPASEKSRTLPSKVRNAGEERPTTISKPAASPPKKASGQEDVWLE